MFFLLSGCENGHLYVIGDVSSISIIIFTI